MNATDNLLTAIRSDIKSELLEEIVEMLRPKINEMLHQNIFTVKEAVNYLKVSESTLRRLVKEEAIPHYKLRGVVYFRQWEIDGFISDRMRGNSKQKLQAAN